MMKKIKLLTILAILFVVAISQSCGDDTPSCDAVVCLNGGTCDTGECVCAAGYEGALCETLSRVKFLGNYALAVSCDDGTAYNGTASITADPSDDLQAVVNTANDSYKITMTGVNSFTVPEQQACTTCDLVENGSGSIDGEGVIEINLVFSDGLSCTNTYTAQ